MKNLDLYLEQFRKSGERIWFEKLYDQFMPPLFRYCYYRTGNKQDAEDICSEAILRAYRNLKKKKFKGRQFLAWLYRVAKNLIIDLYRQKDTRSLQQTDEAGQEPAGIIDRSSYLTMELGIKNDKLFAALASLTELQKEIVILKFIEGYDYQLISRITGKRQNTLRGIVFRALDSIKKYMEENE